MGWELGTETGNQNVVNAMKTNQFVTIKINFHCSNNDNLPKNSEKQCAECKKNTAKACKVS